MISAILISIAAIANGIMDVLANHFDQSRFRRLSNWWNPARSWRMKWKNGDPAQGERFLLSSTALVWLTDAWHLFKGIMLVCLVAVVVCYKPILGLIDIILFLVLWGLFFETTYRWLKG